MVDGQSFHWDFPPTLIPIRGVWEGPSHSDQASMAGEGQKSGSPSRALQPQRYNSIIAHVEFQLQVFHNLGILLI